MKLFHIFHKKPKLKLNKTTITVGILVVVTIGAAIFLFKPANTGQEVVGEAVKKQVTIQKIEKQSEVITILAVSGTVTPRQYTVIRSLVQGTLEFINPAGTEISAGQPLFRIHDDNVENNYFNTLQNLQQSNLIADERVNQAQLALNSAQARKNLAENNLANTISQTDQILRNAQESAAINYNSAYNTLNQFYTSISVGVIDLLNYKYINVEASQIGIKETARDQHVTGAQAFLALSPAATPENIDANLIQMNEALRKSKALADTTVLLLQNTLAGINDIPSEKALMTSLQAQVNTLSATILNNQNTLRTVIINNDLSIKQAQNQLELAEIELSNIQISLSNSQNNALLEKTIKQSQVDNAAYQYSNLNLSSPFAGTILATFAKVGEQVSPGQELLELGNISIVEIEVDVDTEFAQGLKQNDPVKINNLYDGFIAAIEPIGSLASGKVGVTVQSANDSGFLTAGDIAEVEFNIVYKEASLIVIPIKSATIEPSNTYVLVAKDGQAVKREITLGKVFGSRVSVNSGLEEGDELILRDGIFINAGDEVEVHSN